MALGLKNILAKSLLVSDNPIPSIINAKEMGKRILEKKFVSNTYANLFW
jgi:hypothetical protein